MHPTKKKETRDDDKREQLRGRKRKKDAVQVTNGRGNNKLCLSHSG
jgi:hypothetical protein